MSEGSDATYYLSRFVQGLVDGGLQQIVVSPGSRSTPITVVAAQHPSLRLWIAVDERSAGFFALGMAKASLSPVGLICSSGTAAANYYPAVIEAHYAEVPLVVITADRPPELRAVGAPQTIDQTKIYGAYPKRFVDMAISGQRPTVGDYARAEGRRAAMVAGSWPKGPVHYNFPLHEPLVPDLGRIDWGPALGSSVTLAGRRLDADALQTLYQRFSDSGRGIMIVGPDPNPVGAEDLVQVAARFGFPILADALSQLRAPVDPRGPVVVSYDALLRNRRVLECLQPDFIVRVGPMPTSKPIAQAMESAWREVPMVLVDAPGGVRDPSHHLGTWIIEADAKHVCADLLALDGAAPRSSASTAWLSQWKELDDRVRRVVANEDGEDLGEGAVFQDLTSLLPDGAGLYVGNSMPVRDLDTFFGGSETRWQILANRGANGIDGVVSSALGASTVRSPLLLVIGDLSFYHDLNGLAAAKLHDLSCTIVVVNNNGGGIFSFLPQATAVEEFETLFATPLGLDYALVVEMYGGRFTRVTDRAGLRAEVAQGLRRQGLSVVELTTSRQSNVEQHRDLWRKVNEGVDRVIDDWGDGR